MGVAQIILNTKKDRSVRRFHPWIFSGAIKKTIGEPIDGDVVEVCSNKGEYLGTGHYQAVGSIAVRIFDFQRTEINIDFWRDKLQKAWNLRKNLGLVGNTHTNVFRLTHAEGDQLPGLIIDYYNGVAVMQTPSLGMHLMKEQLVELLKDIMGEHLTAVYDKSAEYPHLMHAVPGLTNQYLYKEGEVIGDVLENDCRFLIDWETGQKTGFFIDQRDNRQLLAQYATGKKILNTFCYSGGFSIYALKAGAAEVHSLDSSAKAIELVEQNLAANNFGGASHTSIVADAMDHIKTIGGDYDIIVLDPPAFAKHQSARHKAVQGYKRLNQQAIERIKSGGMIFTYSCSQVVDKSLFNNTIVAAAINAGRKVRILHQMHQPADHPVNVYHPEGEYLKGLVIQVDE